MENKRHLRDKAKIIIHSNQSCTQKVDVKKIWVPKENPLMLHLWGRGRFVVNPAEEENSVPKRQQGVKGLSSLLCQAEVSGHLSGFRINRYTPILTLLLFVDDSLSFLWRGINQRSSCPNVYASSSGQIINFDKSRLFFSFNDAEKSHDDVERILGVDNTSNMEKYLGLPPMLGRETKIIFESTR
ncbi:hypothetical protein GQ457_15G016020 [Hibiscus cannabinus]